MNPSAIRDISQRTQVFENDLKVIPISWRNDPVERIYGRIEGRVVEVIHYEPSDDGVIGYFMRDTPIQKLLFANKLPIEFFNHELMAVNVDSEQSLFEFVSKWGFPYSPMRNERLQWDRWDSLTPAERKTEDYNLRVCRLTQQIEEALHYNYLSKKERNSAISWKKMRQQSDDFGFAVISLDEVRLSILTLQTAIKGIWSHFKHGTDVYLGAINRASRRSLVVTSGNYSPNWASGELAEYGLLTSAICNQIIDTIAEETPWRACACEGCEVVFKRKQSGVLSPYSESIYCSKRCEERQKKRNQRAAAKNRIQH